MILQLFWGTRLVSIGEHFVSDTKNCWKVHRSDMEMYLLWCCRGSPCLGVHLPAAIFRVCRDLLETAVRGACGNWKIENRHWLPFTSGLFLKCFLLVEPAIFVLRILLAEESCRLKYGTRNLYQWTKSRRIILKRRHSPDSLCHWSTRGVKAANSPLQGARVLTKCGITRWFQSWPLILIAAKTIDSYASKKFAMYMQVSFKFNPT